MKQSSIWNEDQAYFKKTKEFKAKNNGLKHFASLMRKNAINWKRTWCGSVLEFLCPILLMLLLTVVRTIVKVQTSPEITAQMYQQAVYPTGAVSPTSGQNSITNQSLLIQSQDLTPFLMYANYTPAMIPVNASTNLTKPYNQQNDPKSPYMFNPPHCYQPTKEYNSPIIAVINGTQQSLVSQDIVWQLKTLFAGQNAYQTALNKTIFPMASNFTFKYFQSKDDLWNYFNDPNYGVTNSAVCFGFGVKQNSKTDYEIELFFNDLNPSQYVSLPNQKNTGADPSQQSPMLTQYGYYAKDGFNLISNWAANAVLRRATNKPNATITALLVPFYQPPQDSDQFVLLLQWILPFFLMLMYIPVLYRTVYRIVFEKVTKAKESMRMMGMGDTAYWASWLCYYTLINIIIVTTCWLILNINCFSRQSAVLLWIWLFLYGQSLFGFIMVTQALFSSPRAAAITTTLIYFGTSVLSALVSNVDTTRATKWAVCWFFPTVTMITGVQPLILSDASGIGLTFKNLTLDFGHFTVRDSLILFVTGGAQMALLGFYLEYVLPKEFGKKRHCCFCITWLTQCNYSRKRIVKKYVNSETDDETAMFETQYLNKECYEPVPSEIGQKEFEGNCLKISGLKKQYENGFQAVNGINLMMYSDQIFVLLGHNGAGKSTTISILTGLFEATGGRSEIFGLDMQQDMDSVRQLMGVCPQHDVLFELLTVKEHLQFFYDLKGGDPKLKKDEINMLMKDVGVWDKRNCLAYTLSGGNKRKLSVAIALCGGSKFVLLDEPTSGMDLSARRQLWNMLKESKKNRIVLLTTHYMDEADILGDRIGIMASGKITALGSSIFLKTKFGAGYNLILVKSNTEPNKLIKRYLRRQLGQEIKIQSEIQSEMTVQIPTSYACKFVKFFKNLDQDLDHLQIQSYGITISTLEEVFLRMGHLEDPTLPIEQAIAPQDPEKQKQFNLKDNVNELDESLSTNLAAVLYKRFANYRRNKKAIFSEVVIPALIMICGISLTKVVPNQQSPSKIIDMSRLPLPQQVLINNNTIIPTQQNSSFVSNLPNQKAFNFIQVDSSNQTIQQFSDQITTLGKSIGSQPPFMYGAYQIYQADFAHHNYKFASFFNLTSQDASGIYPTLMYESVLKTATNNTNFGFKIRLTPYPPTPLLKNRLVSTSTSTVVFVSAIAYSTMIVSVCSYLVVERLNGLKHLQIISGMQLKAYWLGNFIFDFFKFQVTIIVTIVVFAAYGLGYQGASVVYFVFPFGILPFTYVSSFMFSADSAAQTFSMFVHFLVLGIGCTLIFFLRLVPNLQIYGDAFNYVMHIVPTYTLGVSLYCDTNCLQLQQSRLPSTATGMKLDSEVWAATNVSMAVWANFLHLLFWTLQIYLIENGFYGIFKVEPKAKTEVYQLDQDVVTEQLRVKKPSRDIIQVNELRKVYSVPSGNLCQSQSLVAVSDLSFGLARGECFALLGVNGAGKSTTFKSLTREVDPTRGTVLIAGMDISANFEQARKLMGYCPQQNLIFDSMTVDEHLKFYVMIKGIPKDKRQELSEQAIIQLGLGMHRHKAAGTLSGGNKRKLCVAMALVGNPPIIFLDEPSAGMDPESRRFMWSVVGSIAQQRTSAVVLTTHSMEEAEALCTKMGIMVKGGIFKCFGSAQHIKNKFGTGYVIEIKIKSLNESEATEYGQAMIHNGVPNLSRTQFSSEIQTLITKAAIGDGLKQARQLHADINLFNFILQMCGSFDKVELLEKYGSYMRIRVARLDKSIGFVFGLVEQMKAQYDISEYSVSQTTLEQIFQAFAELNYAENVQVFGVTETEEGERQLVISNLI